MPLLLENSSTESCSLQECIEALSICEFDPRDPESTAVAADWLRRLTNNREFLADMLIDRLAGRTQGEVDSGYGPQAIVLSPKRGNTFLRANIWPAEHDLCFRNSGAKSFVYGEPHDHNFSFLTSGYCGPGYRSDYFEYDYEAVTGFSGESASLKFIERSALNEGKLMLYRAHRDVHSQLPPESLSVSLNVMHVDPAQGWFDQYAFDQERRLVTKVLSPNATEAFLRLAVGMGTGEALDFADWVGRSHPSDRLRLASFEARAARSIDAAEEDALWRSGELGGGNMVAQIAKKRRALLRA
ncbi:transposase [Erythrobacter crassostreae]|uniref:Transposase n=1 Tax=Erythrobacter crassostreae TaxID=2828328 RepID=A0A9X1F3R9_9SPHN|nr:transposase [Erythrobacter crassostrea]MBV7259532.1 transposase [Erythrobacter crassostrea]